MKILLSNDDGIHASGLRILYRLLLELGHEIYIVAPHRQHSGSSHSITLSTPLLTHKIYKDKQFYGIAVDGSPADAVKLGIAELYPQAEMVVSGINLGPNVGPSIYYSGTVAAAFEGSVTGKIALAFSLDSFAEQDFECLEAKLRPFMAKIISTCQHPILYNINIPNTPAIHGIWTTRQFQGFYTDQYEKRQNPYGREYYWLKTISFSKEPADKMQPTYHHDVEAIHQGYISMTPLQFDLTNYAHLPNTAQASC